MSLNQESELCLKTPSCWHSVARKTWGILLLSEELVAKNQAVSRRVMIKDIW